MEANGSAPTEKKTTSGIPELALLVLLLAAFIGGAVLVVNAAVADGGSAASFGGAEALGEKVLDRIESMVGEAAQFNFGSPAGAPGDRVLRAGCLDFLADLDGDPATGSFHAGGKRGLERVLISGGASGLTARIYSSADSEPRSVVLCRARGLSEPGSFAVEYELVGPAAVALRLSLAAGAPGEEAPFSREMAPGGPVPVKRIPLRGE